MLEKYPLPCSELDIYSARCGLLHQQINESDLTRAKKAKQIVYSWKGARNKSLKDLRKTLEKGESIRSSKN